MTSIITLNKRIDPPNRPRPTVRVVVWGGLGNQLFCASAGMALAMRLGADLEFGTHHYARDKLRTYELGIFDLTARAVDRPRWHLSARQSAVQRWRNRLIANGALSTTIWRQSGYHYDETFAELSGNVYLRGGFQSYRYFEEVSATIRQAFDLRPHLSEVGRSYCDSAKGDDTVALHIRRGDYVTDPANEAIFTVLAGDYYQRSLGLVCRFVARPRLFVVSDDLDAARAMLTQWPNAEFIQNTTHLDDMHLITSCRHRIIANSSFSWWGAWLDSRADGITIAPRECFTREFMMNNFMLDLYPPGWITI